MNSPRPDWRQRLRLRLRRRKPGEPVSPDELMLGEQSLRAHCEQVLGQAPGHAWRLGGANNSQSLRVVAGEKHYKVFECASAARARAAASALEHLHAAGVPVPVLHGLSGQVVITGWVAGIPGKALSRRVLAGAMPLALARLHQVRPSLQTEAMPHVQWLLERLQHEASPHAGDERVMAVIKRLRERAPATSPLSVIHPDYIPANLVLAESETLVPVDNEFLAVGRGMELDVLNAADALYRKWPRARERFIQAWQTVVDDATLESHRDWWEAMLQVQLIGGAFVRGKTAKGLRRLKALESHLGSLD